MLLQTALSIALVFATSALAVPVDAVQQGSKHNLYLVTCAKRAASPPGCFLGIICPQQKRQAVTYYTAVAYYANGAIDSGTVGRNTNPTSLTTVSDPSQPWEGTQRVAKLGRTGDFSSNIDAGAKTVAKGQLAGDAKLASEDFVCFRDGQTKVTTRDELGDTTASCTADYWCPSIQV
jgi:hypothetical protein